MEKTKNNLKWTSILILIWAAWGIVKPIANLIINGTKSYDNIPSADLAGVISIVSVIISIIFVLPQIYIGVRGLQFLKKPVAGKAHNVWAIILIVMAGIALIACVANFFKANTSIYDNIISVADITLQITFYVEFIIYTKALQKEAA